MKTQPSFSLGRPIAAALALLVLTVAPLAAVDLDAIRREVGARHDQALERLREWIALPSIAAEGLNFPAGAEHMARLARDAGFQRVEILATDGKPGVFATLDAGAKRCVGLYFMYDVKQFDPAEWSSPPLESRMVEKPGLGKVIVGRGAVNQKGPQSSWSRRGRRRSARRTSANWSTGRRSRRRCATASASSCLQPLRISTAS